MTVRSAAAGFALLLLTTASAQAGKPTLREDQAAGTREQIALGAESFVSCAACHGPKGDGSVGIAPALANSRYVAVVSNEALKHTIAEGRADTGMMAWKSMLSAEQIDGLAALLRSWQRSDGAALDNTPLAGDVATGEAVYSAACASCHGKKAKGYTRGTAPGIGMASFLSTISDGELRAIVRAGKDGAVRHPSQKASAAVAKLDNVQLDSVFQFLRANAK